MGSLRKFHNRETGEELQLLFRLMDTSSFCDANGVIECIREEYGDTYFKRSFYEAEYLMREHDSGHFVFMVAVTEDNEVVGTLGFKSFKPRERMIEIATQIFKRRIRHFGVALPMFEAGFEYLEDKDFSCYYALPVMFHRTSQDLLLALSMNVTGFIFGAFNMSAITHGYSGIDAVKTPQSIIVRAKNRTQAGDIYIPREIFPVADWVYGRLNVMYRALEADETLSGAAELDYLQDDSMGNCIISVWKSGSDLTERVSEVISKYKNIEKQVFNVFLNISEKQACTAYSALLELGFRFAGFKPLCSEREMMVLHHGNGLTPEFSSYIMNDEHKELMKQLIAFQEG